MTDLPDEELTFPTVYGRLRLASFKDYLSISFWFRDGEPCKGAGKAIVSEKEVDLLINFLQEHRRRAYD